MRKKLSDNFSIRTVFNEGPNTVEAELSRLLLDCPIQRVYIATAFLTMGGYWVIEDGLRKAIQRTRLIKIVVGTMGHATDPEAIRAVQALAPDEIIRLYTGRGFHPKMYLFQTGASESTLIIGSPNLTTGGLGNNVEAALVIDVSPNSPHFRLVQECEKQFRQWWKAALSVKDALPSYEKVYHLRQQAEKTVEPEWKPADARIPLPPPPPLPKPLREIYLLPFDAPMSEEQLRFIRSKGWMQRMESIWYALPRRSWAPAANLKAGQRIVGYYTHCFPKKEWRCVCYLGLMLAKKYRGANEFFLELVQDPELPYAVYLPVISLGGLFPCVKQGEKVWKKELDRIHRIASAPSFGPKFGIIRTLVRQNGAKRIQLGYEPDLRV